MFFRLRVAPIVSVGCFEVVACFGLRAGSLRRRFAGVRRVLRLGVSLRLFFPVLRGAGRFEMIPNCNDKINQLSVVVVFAIVLVVVVVVVVVVAVVIVIVAIVIVFFAKTKSTNRR